jgi:hypothetical protein
MQKLAVEHETEERPLRFVPVFDHAEPFHTKAPLPFAPYSPAAATQKLAVAHETELGPKD